MDELRMRTPSRFLAIALLLVACVPEPANRLSPSTGIAPTAAPTPVPTPAGPTPTPSFVRPTPTPQPTFLAYTVVRGDTLTGIARRFKTSGRSIAYWNRATYPSLDPDSSKYDPNRLTIGWTLLIIPGSEVDPENLPTFPPSPTPITTPSQTPAATSSAAA
jgi:Tfp pilus assembly protein FimV